MTSNRMIPVQVRERGIKVEFNPRDIMKKTWKGLVYDKVWDSTVVQRYNDDDGSVWFYDENLEKRYVYRIGGTTKVFRNQGWREATILKVIGCDMLVRYIMPSGVEYYNIVDISYREYNGWPITFKNYKPVSEYWLSNSKKWKL